MCYKSHLVILQQRKMVGRDSDLLKIISTYILQAESISSLEDVITTAMVNTVVQVGNELLHCTATLLPTVHDSCDFAGGLCCY